MDGFKPFSLKSADLFWISVCLLVLLPCLYYPYAMVGPEPSFTLAPDWQVLMEYPCTKGPDQCLKVGDRVLKIGSIEVDEFRRDRTLELLDQFEPDGSAVLRVLRGDTELTFEVQHKAKRRGTAQILSLFLLPLTFWLMGTAVVVFLRPRDERWLVLILFSYLSAIWFSSGYASSLHIGGSSVVFHFFIWFFLPVSIHLHLILPSSLLSARVRRPLLVGLYALAGALTILDAFYLLSDPTLPAVWSTLLACLLSGGLILARLFGAFQSSERVASRIMLFGIVLGLGPFMLLHIVTLLLNEYTRFSLENIRELYDVLLPIALISMPILPMSYIFAIYKHHLGALEFRANRLLGIYSFSTLTIVSFLTVLLLTSSRWAPLPEGLLIAILTVSLLFVVVTPALRGRFQNLVDRHVLGIRHSPDEVIDLVAERIPQAFDRAVLAQLVSQEIVPSLLVRQSALHLFEAEGTVTLYEQGLPPGEPSPTAGEIGFLLAVAGRYLHPGSSADLRPWVRLVIPLTIQSRTIGIWLIGRRDPDDFYPATDIHLLSTVANQIAAMVENIRLYEQAQQEIAHRKAAEEAIRRSEERFRTLFEATLEGIAIVRAGEILEVNAALVPIFGYRPEELIGRRLTDLVPEGEAALTPVAHETVGLRQDGTPTNVEIAGKKYVFQGEDVTVVAVRDIEKRKRDEAERKDLQRQLVLSQKMEAIGRLSAGVAHDFNNCLLAIFGYSDLLLDRYREEPFLFRNLSGIKEAGQKAAALTKQLLAFARRQPLEIRVMDLNEVVLGLSKMLQRLLGEDITLATDLHPKLDKVKIDPSQIEQVVVNLAVNARQAMPSGGRLTLKTAPHEIVAGAQPPHSELRPGRFVQLSVSDTGTGMDQETQARVFEPFFTTKGEGTGLGLSTAYGIVRQSGGHIFVESHPGQGACFSILLPATSERESHVAASPVMATDLGTETILLVEDEDEVREVLVQILSKKGYQVLAASSGDEALTIAKRHPGRLDLLLTDVTMPRMKGPQLAEQLARVSPTTRVIYMSGYNDEPLAESGFICLQKPFAPPLLTRTVRAVLDGLEHEPQRRLSFV